MAIKRHEQQPQHQQQYVPTRTYHFGTTNSAQRRICCAIDLKPRNGHVNKAEIQLPN